MPKTVGESRAAAAYGGAPGAAMRQVAAKLAAHGFDVRFPEREEGRCLAVTNLPGTTCDVALDDCGTVTWEYWREQGNGADPARMTALALWLLAGDSVIYPPESAVPRPAGCCLQGTVGRALKAKGLDVSLDVYADHVSFEVMGEITVTNPAQPERGQVRVGDEPGLVWETGCCGAVLPDIGAIADTIVAVVSADIADGYIQRAKPELLADGRGPV